MSKKVHFPSNPDLLKTEHEQQEEAAEVEQAVNEDKGVGLASIVIMVRAVVVSNCESVCLRFSTKFARTPAIVVRELSCKRRVFHRHSVDLAVSASGKHNRCSTFVIGSLFSVT